MILEILHRTYHVIGCIVFWAFISILLIIALAAFWKWNIKKDTLIAQLYDYKVSARRFKHFNNKKKAEMLRVLQYYPHLKNRIGYRKLITILENKN